MAHEFHNAASISLMQERAARDWLPYRAPELSLPQRDYGLQSGFVATFGAEGGQAEWTALLQGAHMNPTITITRGAQATG